MRRVALARPFLCLGAPGFVLMFAWSLSGLPARGHPERGAEVLHEVSPLAEPDLLARLSGRGCRPVELTSVLFRPTAAATRSPSSLPRVRRVGLDEGDLWRAPRPRGVPAPC